MANDSQYWQYWREEIATLLVKEDDEYLRLTDLCDVSVCKILVFNAGSGCLVARIPQLATRSPQMVALKYVPEHTPYANRNMRGEYSYGQTRHQMANEVTLMEGLSHPGAVEYYAPVYLEDDLRMYGGSAMPIGYLMEYCEGGAIGLKEGRYSLEDIWRLTEWLTSVLASLHQDNLLHLDIKGLNILRTGTEFRLIDFGMVQFRHVHEAFGTTFYLPPEDANAAERPTKRRTYDVYAACMTLVYDAFLVGRLSKTAQKELDTYARLNPYSPEEARARLVRHIHTLVEEELCTDPMFAPLVRVVLRGISLDPAHRWQSIVALRQAIAAL